MVQSWWVRGGHSDWYAESTIRSAVSYRATRQIHEVRSTVRFVSRSNMVTAVTEFDTGLGIAAIS